MSLWFPGKDWWHQVEKAWIFFNGFWLDPKTSGRKTVFFWVMLDPKNAVETTNTKKHWGVLVKFDLFHGAFPVDFLGFSMVCELCQICLTMCCQVDSTVVFFSFLIFRYFLCQPF